MRSNGYVDFRVTARDIRLRIESRRAANQPRPGVTHVIGWSAPVIGSRSRGGIADGDFDTDFTHRSAAALNCRDDPKTSDVLSNYLRSPFSLVNFAGTVSPTKLSVTTAAPGLMLQATDDPTKIFVVQVDSAGAITATAVGLGGGKVLLDDATLTIGNLNVFSLAWVVSILAPPIILTAIAEGKMQSFVEVIPGRSPRSPCFPARAAARNHGRCRRSKGLSKAP